MDLKTNELITSLLWRDFLKARDSPRVPPHQTMFERFWWWSVLRWIRARRMAVKLFTCSLVLLCLLQPLVVQAEASLVKPHLVWQEEADNVSNGNNRLDYTDHSVVKIAEHNIHMLFNPDKSRANHDSNEHEILWYDRSDHNSTYAFVRLGPKTTHRIKRDLSRMNPQPVFVTSNLQSWIDRERPLIHTGHGHFKHNSAEFLEEEDEYMPPEQAYHGMSSTVSSSTALAAGGLDEKPHRSRLVPTFVLNQYHPLAQVNRFLKELASRHSGVTVFTIGTSHENRPINAIEILNNPADNRFVWIDGCTHAREWVTVTTALYLIEQVIVHKVPLNFIVVPVLNVDGYVYTWTKDRMWRKNRRPYIASRFSQQTIPDRCTGVDLNRNYDINFGGTGSSDNPCSYLYQGPFAFSEPEVRAASELLSKNRDRIKMTLSLHSFNQLWACPNAYTTERTADHEHHMRVLRAVQRAVYNTNGVSYDAGPLGAQLYLGSGFMMDWIYHKLGIRDAYLVELRDRGFFGFILPADQIWPTATETWQGVRTALNQIFHLNI